MKDQKALLIRCMKNDVPAIVISGNDLLALETVQYYLALAKKNNCNKEFVEDLEMVVKHFEEHSITSQSLKLPD